MNLEAGRQPKVENGERREFAPWTDSSQPPLIRFENVSKRFGDVTAIANLSIDIFER